MPKKNNSGHASTFMAYWMGVSLTVGALARPLSNFSSQPITLSLSCQLAMFISAKLTFKKRKKATDAAGKVNFALAPPLPQLLKL